MVLDISITFQLIQTRKVLWPNSRKGIHNTSLTPYLYYFFYLNFSYVNFPFSSVCHLFCFEVFLFGWSVGFLGGFLAFVYDAVFVS